MNGVGHLESEIKEDEGDAGLSGIDTDHTSMSWSLNNLIRIFTLEKEGLRKGREEEKESPLSEGIFANTP